MKYLLLPALFILVSCSKPTTQSEPTSAPADSIPAAQPVAQHEHPAPPEVIFIGLAKPLKETGEFYVSVYHIDNHTELNHNELDSVIFEDPGYVRKLIPMETAKKYFYLDGIEKLRVYNDQHAYLDTFPLKRIELLSTEISSEYAAVF